MSATPWVVMGRVFDALGVQGWIKVRTFTEQPEALSAHNPWYLRWPAGLVLREPSGPWCACVLEACHTQPKYLAAKLAGRDTRDAALALRGCEIAVPRTALPDAKPGEYYWNDLLGLSVQDARGRSLGTVQNLLETGAHDVLVTRDAAGREHLLPFVAAVVRQVDLAARMIQVDWEEAD